MAKKKSSTSETERTLAECKRLGWYAQKTEYWLPSFRSHDVVAAAKELVANPTKKGLAVLERAVLSYSGNPGIRKDLFGFIDVLALTDEGFVAIQSTSRPNIGSRHLKIRTDCQEAAKHFLRAGGRIEVWGWFKAEKAIDRKFWQVKKRLVEKDDVDPGKPF